MNRLAITLCGFILAALPSASALADTVYTYTGNDFTRFLASSGITNLYTTHDFVSGSFTVSAPLAPNLSIKQISVDSVTLTDGVQTLTSATIPRSNQTIYIATDSNGNIDDWLVALLVVDPHDFAEAQIYTDGAYGSAGDGGFVNYTTSAYNQQVPGTWTVSTTDSPSPVPEPSSLFLLGTGAIGGLGIFRRKLVW